MAKFVGTLTKAELIAKGKKLGLNLKSSMLKGELVKAVGKAEKSASKSTASPIRKSGEK
jgi:hypothetical protein